MGAALDPAVLREAMPGCEALTEIAPRTYRVTLRVGVALRRGVHNGTVMVSEERPHESFRLQVRRDGRSSTKGAALVRLVEMGPNRTSVRYRAELRPPGMLALAGRPVLAGAARMLIGQTFRNLERQVRARTGTG